MSASLVGSEMCIRDRHTMRDLFKGMNIGPERRLDETEEHDVRRPTQGAVSYTHLTLPTICSV
eukprot:9597827-Alexandrium_andersonii.AAC.1